MELFYQFLLYFLLQNLDRLLIKFLILFHQSQDRDRIKKRGKIWIGLTNCVKSEREYKKLGEIWQMVSRTAFEQLNNSITILLLSIFGLIILYLLFPLIIILSLFNFEILNFVLALFGYSIISVIYLPTIKFYNLSKFNALLLPFSALIYIFITLNSAINYYLGYGNVWKARKY